MRILGLFSEGEGIWWLDLKKVIKGNIKNNIKQCLKINIIASDYVRYKDNVTNSVTSLFQMCQDVTSGGRGGFDEECFGWKTFKKL